ncbi:DNA-processing protein DprA [Curtobacterium sp. 20TX0008]|uniref:DNA-processing protein DprA n=1 Tax=Curtobacterium sp. 20TX0008 TaxID=3022018 RepID=UPI00232C7883|nr:DNA-processing protein DprA [Curtobacterium sp. 20TX0008]MDB6426560.1 DNA-processing protein DprA [Curtobacterium sp. 20TX0008]
MTGAPDLLETVAVLLGRAVADAVDPVEAAARVAWSAVVEPGDAVAGILVQGLGAERSFALVRSACDDGPVGLLDSCIDRGVPGAESPAPFARTLRIALERWRPRLARVDVLTTLEAARAVGARLVVPGTAGWPTGVDDLGPHAPVVLWTRSGRRASGPALAVVGSRANTVAGAEATAEIASAAADAGCTVVSGGAYGIDATAHRVAVAAGTPTVAVLAGGIDQLYPTGNVELLRNVARQGSLLAESPPGTRPTRWRFLARNRLIAALGAATVVVEAGARSGALNTAHHAAQLGRPVFAVPGAFSSSASVGCHRLVAQGRAQIVVGPGDPVEAVVGRRGSGRGHPSRDAGPTHADEPIGGRQDPEVVRVLDALGRRALGEQEIAVRSGMSAGAVADALALAELQGLVTHTVGGWTRS